MPESVHAQPEAPATAYRDRIAVLKLREGALQRKHIRLGWVRLAFGIGTLILLLPPRLWAFLPFVAFAIAARVHGAVLKRLAATRRVLAAHEHALARVEDRWAGLHPRTSRVDPSPSLYAADLDLFGPASLFELLCDARTSLGEDTLASWLLAPASVQNLVDRQAAVADLRERLPLREAFAEAPGPALALLDQTALTAWAERLSNHAPSVLQWIAPLLVLLTMASAWLSSRLHSLLPLFVMLAIDGSLTFSRRRSFPPLFTEAQAAAKALHAAAALLAAIEGQTYSAPLLLQLQARLRATPVTASRALFQLAQLSEWIDARANYLVRILDAPLLYSLQLASVVSRWKGRYGPHLGSWLQILGEFEALLSLATYSYEHPQDPFPRFTEGAPSFHATGLGHPLLPAASCVRNDVSLGKPTHIFLVSGSNMSGKSTLLRSIGTNAVLAFAGAPVRAHTLSLSPLTIAASIQLNDSLQAGRSRFYAEILRLRAITEAARTNPPVLFLLDELLAGTNSSDRLEGARGLLRELLLSGAIGLMSTHDLALTSLTHDIAEVLGAVRTVHFQDEVVNGQLRFDYTLRDGPVQRSNGLALMRLIGLDV